jgi:hypothetical protein
MINVRNRDSRYQSIEVFEWQVGLIFVCESFIVLDNSPEIVVCIFALLLHKSDTLVKHLDRLEDFTTDVKIVCNIFELVIIKELRNKLEKVLVVFKGCVLDQSDETQRVSDLSNTLTSCLKIVLVFCQLAQLFCKLLSPVIWVQPTILLFVSHKHPSLSEKQIFDCVIEQELLAEVINLLSDKPVKLVHNV